MTERKYSLAEIDRMRASLMILRRGDERKCEDQLRTYMLNGTDPDELVREEAEEVNRRIDEARRRPKVWMQESGGRMIPICKPLA